jgi:Domain of unknown function (DUF6484)
MSLASNEHPPSSLSIGELPDESSACDTLPPPLAEIAARSARGALVKTGHARRGPSRARVRKPRARRKTSGSSNRPALSGEVTVGMFVGINEAGEPQVTHPLNPSNRPVLARSTVPLDPSQVGRAVVIAFACGDVQKPIIMGVLWQPRDKSPVAPPPVGAPSQPPLEVERDGEQLVLTAEREIVLRCGKASLTLTRAGKVLIRGAYLLSRSSGVNRIKGGSVQIN